MNSSHDQARPDPAKQDSNSAPGAETVFEGSISEEKHPEVTPQNPGDFDDKVKLETAGEEGLVAKAKRVVQEMDRDLSGEYQRREDSTAPPPASAEEG